ncbi:MAG: ExbD/TolR family protein [Kiritimatiellales bacterium]
MKFKIPTEGGDENINMAPMIDMVFLLLIFFMAASHMTKLERIPVPLPEAGNARVPEKTGARQVVTLLATDDSGADMEIFMNLQKMTLDEFKADVEKAAEAETLDPLYLRVDRRLRHRHVREVMQACAEAGIADVTFGVFESGK